MLAVNFVVSLIRFAACIGVSRGWIRSTPEFTDFYVLISLLWAAIQGWFTGVGVYSNVAVLQTICLMASTAFQGMLSARNYPAPRFAMAIMLLFEVPVALGSGLAANHWYLINIVLAPPWIFGSLATILRFQRLSIGMVTAKLSSDRQARHDPLTGALNRLGLGLLLEDANLHETMTLFCLDLDGFKLVNDTCGHAAGDVLLKLVTARIRHTIRGSDFLARHGGDEFVVVAPGLGPDGAGTLAAKLIEKITRDPYELGDAVTRRIGVSIGVACRPHDGLSVDELMIHADNALYAAKEQGKGIWRRCAARTSDPLST